MGFQALFRHSTRENLRTVPAMITFPSAEARTEYCLNTSLESYRCTDMLRATISTHAMRSRQIRIGCTDMCHYRCSKLQVCTDLSFSWWRVGRCSGIHPVYSGRSLLTFQRCLLHHQAEDMTMETVITSDMSDNFYQTTRRNTPKDRHLQNPVGSAGGH